MIIKSFNLFILRKLPFSHFDFPRWQSVLAVSFIGLLTGMAPDFLVTPPGMPDLPLWLGVVNGLIGVWAVFLVILPILRWWLRRGGRWDGQGDLLNLVATSWLVVDILGASLMVAGVPLLLTLPVWLYSIWVSAHAMESAIPKASLGYCIAGIVITLVPSMVISGLTGGVAGIVMVMTGLLPVGTGM